MSVRGRSPVGVRHLGLGASLVAALLTSPHARATVVQVDGRIVPVLSGGACAGNLQVCLDGEEGVSPPAANAIYAVLDAAQVPEIFLPNTATAVTFKDIGEGAGFENSFGYYNVGDDPTISANLHPILGCTVSAATHTQEAAGYVANAEVGTIATVNFATERSAGRYRGGYIAFYLITPEGHPSGENCGDFVNGTDELSLLGRAYFTQRDYNNDGDFVHHLVYQSRINANRFHFGFEDLFRGGDNDYEDMAITVTGLTPPCAPGVELCNGRDDDCDGLVDAADPSLTGAGAACTCDGVGITCEGGARAGICRTGATACVSGALLCRSGVSARAETCNALDDNCNGTVDDATTDTGATCDGADGDLCREGSIQCTGGALLCSDATPTSTETCNGLDDDCNGAVDDGVGGLGVACDGADGDLCAEGVTTCSAGAVRCTDTTGTNVERCDGVDDDCDGAVDDAPTDVGLACSVGAGACRRTGATACVAGAPSCNVSAGTPSAERCNTLDDDCDGSSDEDFMLGTACDPTGACGLGVLECAGPLATRCSTAPGGSSSGAVAESCNGLDDDCDGIVDEGLTDLGSCGSSTGECAPGRLRCLAAAPVCVGGVGPSPELCDGLDNDCDGSSDDAPVDAGASCGSDEGACSAGVQVCRAGALACVGAVGPAVEVCNALDDDCNAIVDDRPSDAGVRCGATDVGACGFGATICVSGGLVCAGTTDPSPELCNGIDDDCDGATDDDPIDVGRTCGSAMGTCAPGTTRCVAGAVACVGATTGAPEVCNGIDDDCDTIIDDAPSDEGGVCGETVGVCEEGNLRCIAGALQCVGGVLGGTEVCNGLDDDCDGLVDGPALCEGGVCMDGRCSVACEETEFGERCAPGETCVDHFCVEDLCFGVTCPAEADGTRTVCRQGTCVPVCDTLTCDAPNVCRRTDGACVGNNCIFLPYLCTDAEICAAGACVPDPCEGVTCGDAEFCRGGACVGTCAGVRCPAGEACRGGACAPTGCEAGCGPGDACVSGACVNDVCASMGCAPGEVCDPSQGACVDDPCRPIQCPGGAVCRLGDCFLPSDFTVDAGPRIGLDGGGQARSVIATGGGLGCDAGASGRRGSPAVFIAALLGLWLLGRGRRAGTGLLGPALAATLSLASGCEVAPYCIANCGDGALDDDAGAGDGGTTDAATASDAGAAIDGCAEGAEEACNAVDDDCDGRTDESFDLSSDVQHCGACDVSCERTGALTECVDAACVFRGCFGGYVDVDGDTTGPFADTDGCEYRCFQSNGGVEACDTLDNDCDGRTDETFDLNADGANCGRCGQVCTFFRVDAATCEAGVCRFDPAAGCSAGYLDTNGVQFDGCEFECTPTGAEVCDGLDNDCDTRADEGFALDTDVTNCGRCGRRCSFPHVTPRCAGGTCGFDPSTDCEPGFSDRDGVTLNGCEYPCIPTADPTEVCDRVDNDCDGRVDGPTSDAGGACTSSPTGVALGACAATGVRTCVGGALVCVGAPEPSSERCDGIDNDCDGTADDSPLDVGRVCRPAVGTCTAGFTSCTAGALGCVQFVGPAAEVCNGLDDDCDGSTDESPTDASLGTSCGSDVGLCVAGTVACTAGRLTCAGEVRSALEVCNGLDDDCDGRTDVDAVDVGGACGSGLGACVPGSEICVAGAVVCTGGVGPGPELCNGLDDDCNGSTDEVAPRACYTGTSGTRGVGACRAGTQLCTGGAYGACAGEVTPTTETCDGTDQDCDGRIDEGITRTCYTGSAASAGVGVCRGGVQACTLGVFGGACVGEVVPVAETCNGADDNCNGSIDEASGGGPLTRTCYSGASGTSGVGTCRSGTQTCRFGAFDAVCSAEVVPVADVCGDGIDTDCDALGDTAEGCLSAGTELRLDGPAVGTGTGEETAVGVAHSFDLVVASAGNPAGRTVYAAWSDLRTGASDIFLVRSSDGGATWSTITNVSLGIAEACVRPVLAAAYDPALGTDRVFVAFQRVVGGVRNVRMATSSNGFATFAVGAADLETTAGTDNFKHSVAVSRTGARVVVAWEQLNTTTLARRVFSRASLDGGATFAASRQVSVNVGAAPNAGEPVVAITSTGRFVFAWREARSPGRPTFDVYATYADDTTTAIPTARELRLDGDTSNVRASDDLRIAVDDARVYLVWNDVSTIMSGGADVLFARSTDAGGTWSTERILDDPSAEVSSSSQASIAVDPRTASTTDDRLFVVWTDTRDGTQIFLSSSPDSGASWTTPVRASQRAGGAVPGVCDSPQVAVGGSNSVVVAYVNDAAGASTYRRVLASVSIDAGATWQLTDPTLDAGGGEADTPVIAPANGTGPAFTGALVGWIDFRSGTRVNGDVYRLRVGR